MCNHRYGPPRLTVEKSIAAGAYIPSIRHDGPSKRSSKKYVRRDGPSRRLVRTGFQQQKTPDANVL